MGDPIDPDKLVTIPDAAREFGYHPKYLSKLASDGAFKAWRYGKLWLTTKEAVAEYKRDHSSPIAVSKKQKTKSKRSR